MPQWFWSFLDMFFVAFHSTLILFNIFGWLVPRWRLVNFVCLLLTGGSWFVLGLFYGLGYCPLTDWHWQVLQELGESQLPASYIQYILKRVIGITLTARTADLLTLCGWLLALVISGYLNLRVLVGPARKGHS